MTAKKTSNHDDKSLVKSPSEEYPPQSKKISIDEFIIKNAEKYEYESFVIEDETINSEVINRLFLAIESEEPQEIGQKRCTKYSKKGRRFCVQREGFLKWRFGWDYK